MGAFTECREAQEAHLNRILLFLPKFHEFLRNLVVFEKMLWFFLSKKKQPKFREKIQIPVKRCEFRWSEPPGLLWNVHAWKYNVVHVVLVYDYSEWGRHSKNKSVSFTYMLWTKIFQLSFSWAVLDKGKNITHYTVHRYHYTFHKWL